MAKEKMAKEKNRLKIENKLAKENKTKLKVGFYGITGCAGCQLSVLFNEDEILSLFDIVDVTAFPFIRERNIDKDFDLFLLRGLWLLRLTLRH